MIRYLHINWVANQVFNTSNSNVLGSLHVNVNVNVNVGKVTVTARATLTNTNREQTLFQVFHDIEGS